mgnify:CR=1 FL=1
MKSTNIIDWETFFVTHLGVSIKSGKEKVFTIWGGDAAKDPIMGSTISFFDTWRWGDPSDKEPDTPKGVVVYANGISVDSDGDTMPNYKDKYRFELGSVNNKGCPITRDQDKDGIPDRLDKCIDVKGLEIYIGCLDEESLKLKEIVEVLDYFKNIYFNTNSKEMKSATYYTLLDEVANIMLKNSNVSFSVSGYTDNTGNKAYNQRLSEKRVKETRLYLIARGVEEDRITAKGHGKLNPKIRQ